MIGRVLWWLEFPVLLLTVGLMWVLLRVFGHDRLKRADTWLERNVHP